MFSAVCGSNASTASGGGGEGHGGDVIRQFNKQKSQRQGVRLFAAIMLISFSGKMVILSGFWV